MPHNPKDLTTELDNKTQHPIGSHAVKETQQKQCMRSHATAQQHNNHRQQQCTELHSTRSPGYCVCSKTKCAARNNSSCLELLADRANLGLAFGWQQAAVDVGQHTTCTQQQSTAAVAALSGTWGNHEDTVHVALSITLVAQTTPNDSHGNRLQNCCCVCWGHSACTNSNLKLCMWVAVACGCFHMHT